MVYPNAEKSAEMADRRKKVASLYLNKVAPEDIAISLGVDRSTVTRDTIFLRKKWREEAQEDIACHMSRELAELERMELEVASQYQTAKKAGKELFAVKWMDTRLKIKDRRAKYLGLDQPDKIHLKAEHSGEVSINFIVKDLGENINDDI